MVAGPSVRTARWAAVREQLVTRTHAYGWCAAVVPGVWTRSPIRSYPSTMVAPYRTPTSKPLPPSYRIGPSPLMPSDVERERHDPVIRTTHHVRTLYR